ncbi:MAG: mechanosensitive ion channel, partial [Thiotrichaceae bacterium]|nr:mechanosensitive ion channel [Thiotrichaceae bacterium]
AEIHFKWSATLISGLRCELRRLMITFLPIIFITKILIYEVETTISGGLVRIALILILITFAIFFYRLVKPKTGILYSIAGKYPDSYFAQYQTLWFITGLIGIFVLFGLIFAGYVYTAAQLTASLLYTAWLIFIIVILQQISVRWLLLTQRRYALTIAYEKRIEIVKKKSMDEHQEQDIPDHSMDFDEPEIDIVSLSEESIKLLNMVLFILGIVGLSAIWSGVLPALGFFEQFVLWHHSGLIDGVETIIPVTLWDLILALLIMVLTIVSAKRLPAIIEILLLQNTAVSSGDRYTITTLINYAIVGTGFFSVFNILGADWVRFQWLFAALSVGIGFGLQEIVANFISGII